MEGRFRRTSLGAALAIGLLGILAAGYGPIAQEQTQCPKCRRALEPDWKFCDQCGEETEYNRYLVLVGRAASSTSNGSHEAAARNYIEAAKKRVSNKRKATALLGAGRAYLQIRRFDEAYAELDKAAKLDPAAPEPLLLLADIELNQRKNAEKAKEYLLEAVRISGQPDLAALKLGDIEYDLRNFAEARRQYEIVEGAHQQNAQFQYKLARCIMATDKDAKLAIAKLEQCHKLQPQWLEPVIELATLHEGLEQHNQSAMYWGRAGALQKENPRHPLRQALNLVLAREWPGAAAAFRATLERNPNQMEALMGLGRVLLYRIRDPKAAKPHLERALSIEPRNADADYLLGLASDLSDGRPSGVLVGGATCERAVAWHPSGRTFAFQSDRDKSWHIYTMTVGGTPVRLTTAGQNGDPAFSPDGTKIAYHGDLGDSEIYVMDARGRNVTRLTTRPRINDESPSWSPDGSKIAFQSNEAGRNNWEIYVMGADGKNITRLTNSNDDDVAPKFSPDGSRIVFISRRGGQKDVYIMDADGKNPTRLTNDKADDNWPSFSPDGKLILFSSKRSGKWQLYTMGVDGSDQKPLGAEADDQLEGAWNPNGVRIATTMGKDPKTETFDIRYLSAPAGFLPIFR